MSCVVCYECYWHDYVSIYIHDTTYPIVTDTNFITIPISNTITTVYSTTHTLPNPIQQLKCTSQLLSSSPFSPASPSPLPPQTWKRASTCAEAAGMDGTAALMACKRYVIRAKNVSAYIVRVGICVLRLKVDLLVGCELMKTSVLRCGLGSRRFKGSKKACGQWDLSELYDEDTNRLV